MCRLCPWPGAFFFFFSPRKEQQKPSWHEQKVLGRSDSQCAIRKGKLRESRLAAAGANAGLKPALGHAAVGANEKAKCKPRTGP